MTMKRITVRTYLRYLLMLILMVLLAVDSLAMGLKIEGISLDVEYDQAQVYRIKKSKFIDSQTGLNNNSKINADVLPGSNITFKVGLVNTFQEKNEDLKDLIVRITIEDIDDGTDLEEENSEDFELESKDEKDIYLKLKIPLNVNSGTYNVIIEAEGAKNKTVHKTKINLKLPIKKQSHDIRIISSSLDPSIVQCGENKNVRLLTEIMNFGSNNEENIVLEVKVPDLKIKSVDKGIFLESSDDASKEDKSYTKSLTIEIPDSYKSGTHPVSVNLYWKDSILFDKKNLELIVKDCISTLKEQTEQQSNKTEQIQKEVIQEGVIQEGVIQKEIVVSTKEVSVYEYSILSVAVLGSIIIIILIGLIVFVYLHSSNP